ncbi:6045_t:CDS:2, partial [Racocetra persica]
PKLNDKIKKENWNIIFLIDNVLVHIILDETQEKLSNLRVEFLSAQTTSILQPCDAEIINSFKSWLIVSTETISNCWIKTRILLPYEIVNRYDIFVDIKYRELDELENLLTKLPGDDNLSISEYISIKENKVESKFTNNEILAAVAKNEEEIVSEVCETNILKKVGCGKTKKAINTILRFLYKQEDRFGEII